MRDPQRDAERLYAALRQRYCPREIYGLGNTLTYDPPGFIGHPGHQLGRKLREPLRRQGHDLRALARALQDLACVRGGHNPPRGREPI